MSTNTNLTIDIINKNKEKFMWHYISYNDFNENKKQFIDNKYREYYRNNFMKNGLFKELMENVWHPRNIHKFKYLDYDTYGDLDI
jgi:hypothetical protein